MTVPTTAATNTSVTVANTNVLVWSRLTGVRGGVGGWAALSAGNLAAVILPPPPLAAEVVIAADHDASGIGQRFAERAAERFIGEGRRVRIALPPTIGTDFNDLLAEPAP